jgi:hypothetical protein
MANHLANRETQIGKGLANRARDPKWVLYVRLRADYAAEYLGGKKSYVKSAHALANDNNQVSLSADPRLLTSVQTLFLNQDFSIDVFKGEVQ